MTINNWHTVFVIVLNSLIIIYLINQSQVAQFYHKFSLTDSGYDSTFNTSFKYSSSEEESPRRVESSGKRRGTSSHHNLDGKKRRPLGMGEFQVTCFLFWHLVPQLLAEAWSWGWSLRLMRRRLVLPSCTTRMTRRENLLKLSWPEDQEQSQKPEQKTEK